MNKSSSIFLSLVWLGTLGGAYWFGHRSGLTTVQTNLLTTVAGSSPGDATRARGNVAQAGNGASANPRPVLTLKQILAQLKSAVRGGGMNSPATGMKLMNLLSQITDADIPAALEAAADIKEPQAKVMLYMMLLTRMAEKDGPGALKYAEEKLADQGPMIQMSKMGILSAWAEHDPEGAWNHYLKGAEEDSGSMFGGRRMALISLFSTMGAQDLDGAFKKFGQLAEKEERSMALMGLAQTATDEASMARLMAEVDKLPDAEERKSTRGQMIGQMAMLEPERAVKMVQDLPAAERSEVSRHVGQMMMMSDPKRGAQFMLENTAPEKLSSAYDQVVSTWAHGDPNAAGAWLNSQPKGPESDSARATFSTIVTDRDPVSAMEWAKSITKEEARVEALKRVYSGWKRKDPTAAESALEGAGLSAEQLQGIRTPKETPRDQ